MNDQPISLPEPAPPGLEPAFTPHALRVLEARYLLKDERGRARETPERLLRRVARALASVESRWGADPDEVEARFYGALARLDLLPNSPTLMNAGKPQGQLSACFVLPIEDRLDAIFDAIKHAAVIHGTGGGTGFSFARLRPKNAPVKGGGRASGPVSFLRVFNAATAAVHQGGVRRGANMGILRVDHPDVLEFIDVKRDPRELTHFNISVAATDAFMQALADGTEYDLLDPRTGLAVGSLDARTVWQRIVEAAWLTGDPGLIFIDRVNEANPTPELGAMESTNPCVVGETRLATQHGLVEIEDLHLSGSDLICTVDRRAFGEGRGTTTRPAAPAFVTSESAPVWRVVTRDGFEITATRWHDVYTPRGKVKLSDLRVGDELLVQSGKGQFGQEGSYELGYIIGLIAGDGCCSHRGRGLEAALLTLWGDDRRSMPQAVDAVNRLDAGGGGRHRAGAIVEDEHDTETVESVVLARVLAAHGFSQENKHRVPDVVWRGTEACVRGYLHGLFQADGTVDVSGHAPAPTRSVRLASSHPDLLKDVQVLLANFGVFAPIRLRRPAGRRRLPDGEGGHAYDDCPADYELTVGGESRDRFMSEVGFPDRGRRTRRYQDWAKGKALNRTQRFTSKVEAIEYVGERRVYDTTQPDRNTVIFNGLVTGQCGELPLLPYESCNLGSVDVSKHITADRSDVDWVRLAATVHLAVRMLDDVVEANAFPLPQIASVTQANRKIGLGVMGWADLLIELGVPYASEAAVALAGRLMRFIKDEARTASRALARERGPFPAWHGSRWAKQGEAPLRNATVTTIAPTGTIALLAGCSSGIEPIYAVAYVRRALEGEAELAYLHPAFERVARERGFWSEAIRERVLETGSVAGVDGVPADVQELFRTAHEIPPEWHVRMQAAFQAHCENAVSKTINLPREAPVEAVAAAYRLAYDLGCKGITVYRDGSREGQILAARRAGAMTTELPTPASCAECIDVPEPVEPEVEPVEPRAEPTP